MDKPLTKKDLLKAIQRMEEVGIIQGYKSMSDMFRMFVAQIPEAEPIEEKKEPEWCDKINEWFRPSSCMNIDFTNSGRITELVYRDKGKTISVRTMLKDFIRNLLKEFAEEISKNLLQSYVNNKRDCWLLNKEFFKSLLKKYGIED
ncbi:MAG: hypothetical protein KBA02_00225 [Paludibacteraceae bacterium]|nr:hypothetical protein [Paludibacteraceae bacterium]